MNKRCVQIIFRQTGEAHVFSSVTEMYARLGRKVIGLTLHSLFNALSKGRGKYENSKFIMRYLHRTKFTI